MSGDRESTGVEISDGVKLPEAVLLSRAHLGQCHSEQRQELLVLRVGVQDISRDQCPEETDSVCRLDTELSEGSFLGLEEKFFLFRNCAMIKQC